MGAEQTKSLMEQRADLEKQLDDLKAQRRDGLYTPGISILSDQSPSPDEQTDLQIEGLQAAIAQIDTALKQPSENSDTAGGE
jgi:hypothetical protein